MSNILVTVVVPVYNAHRTIARCINSIVRQTFIKHMEIILVDDGSTDDSGRVCDSFAAIYDNVRVIHQPNAGMGAAYNQGISVARGEYIGLVESDDFIEPRMYEKMYNNAKHNDSDLVKCGIFYLYDLQKYTDFGEFHMSHWEDYILKQITSGPQPFTIFDHKLLLTYHSSVWATLYRSDFIKQIQFSTQPDASYQDFFFMIKCLVLAKRISAVPNAFYHWNTGNQDASCMRTDEKLMRILDQAIMSKQWLIDQGRFDELFSEYYKQMMISTFIFYRQIRPDLKPVFWARLREFFADVNLKNLPAVVQYFSKEEMKFVIELISQN